MAVDGQRKTTAMIRSSLLACLLGLWFGYALATSIADTTDLPLSTEDLIEAYERGDISFEELQEFLDLLETRTENHVDRMAAAREAAGLWTSPSVPPAKSESPPDRPAGIRLRVSDYLSLRGDQTPRQGLRFFAGESSTSIHLNLGRSGHGAWHAQHLLARLNRGRISLQAGALQLRWTGGLLTGPAPRIIAQPTEFLKSLLQPRLARMVGTAVRVDLGPVQIGALYSQQNDPDLWHDVRGVRATWSSGGLSLSPAVIRQHLIDLQSHRRYSAFHGGLSSVYGTDHDTITSDLAISNGAVAFQTYWTGTTRDHVSWHLEFWRISKGYRNPLMYARAETDREVVWYPELKRGFSSTSTGEQGGELRLMLDPAATRISLRATWWREFDYRPGALKASATFRHPISIGLVRVGYALRRTPSLRDMELRHRGQVRVQINPFWIRVSGSVTHLSSSRVGRTGGQITCGYKHRSAGLGYLRLSAALNFQNISDARFITIRFSQRIRTGPGHAMGFYLRWRSRYQTLPAALSLRLNTEISI